MARLSLLFLSALNLATATTTTPTCYAPNGTAITTDPCCDGIYSPCNGTGMCCALGRPVYHINVCLGNGLCEDVSTGWIWRESCTDPTWKDPSCLKLCMEDIYLASDTGDAELTACADGTYCCGSGNATCCEQGLGYAIVNGEVIPAASANLTTSSSTTQSVTGTAASTSISMTQVSPSTLASTSVLPSTSPSSSTSPSPSSSTSPSPSPPPLDKSTLGIGIGVGLGAGLPLAAAILAVAVLLRRKQGGGKGAGAEQERQRSQQERLEKEEPKYVVMESELAQGPGAAELHSVPHQPTVAVELSGEGQVFEK